MNKIFKIQKNKKSFSIGEVMLSVFILGVTLVTVSQLFVSGLKNFANTRDTIIASMLAQEGVELVKNVRDNNWVKGNPSFLDLSTGGFNIYCAIDVDSGVCEDVDVYSPDIMDIITLHYDNTRNLYVDSFSTSGTSVTKFKRVVAIQDQTDNIVIDVYVLWGAVGGSCDLANKCIKVSSRLSKWGE